MLISNYLSSITYNNLHMLFDLSHFGELGQNYKNILVQFLVEIKTLKFASEINLPLEVQAKHRRAE